MTASTPSRRLALATVAVAAVLTTATACGSSGDDDAGRDDVASLDDGSSSAPDTATDASTAPVDLEDAMLAFTECMRDHGVDMPDPQVSGEGGVAIAIEGEMDDEEFQAAQTACEPLMENARGDLEIDPEQLAEMQEEMLEFTACMRDHGIDMADPVFGDDGRVTQQGPPPGADGSELDGDEFDAAAEECGRGEGGPVIAASPAGGSDGGPSFSAGEGDSEGDG